MAWVASDLEIDGAPLAQCPRGTLRRMMADASESGMAMKTGVEVEFMLLDADSHRFHDHHDTTVKPCYDTLALMRQYDIIAEVCGYMEKLGWGPYQNDHEDANGQFEMNWEYDDALVTADRQAFFKYMVRTVAESHGARATFMPKPFADKTGNGAHIHITMHDESGANLFKDPSGVSLLSPLATHFQGGLMNHVEALTAVGNPTVNSYKRIAARTTDSGATWAPSMATHGGNDRTHTIRVPDAPRLEFRLGDMGMNPYLYPAAVLAAGLEGIASKADPGPAATVAAWDLPADQKRPLPKNLLDALRSLEADKALRERLGEEVCVAYGRLRMQQWESYSAHLTQWELDNYLDV